MKRLCKKKYVKYCVELNAIQEKRIKQRIHLYLWDCLFKK